MGIGDRYLHAVNSKKKDDDNNLEQSFMTDASKNSKNRKTNIFNKARGSKACQKFSVNSEQPQALTFFKQTGEGIVNRDDGGNLISANQFANNLVSKPEKRVRKSVKKKKERSDANDTFISTKLEGNVDALNDTGILSDLEKVESPYSPEPKGREGGEKILFAN